MDIKHSKSEAMLGKDRISSREPSRKFKGRTPWDPSPMEWGGRDNFAFKQSVDRYINDIIQQKGPSDLPEVVREAVLINYLSTQARLTQHNFEAYEDLRARYEAISDEELELLDKARTGTAGQRELVQLIRDTPLTSIELAKLTHPYGERSEYLAPMQEVVELAVIENGGSVFLNDDTAPQRIKINHHQTHNDHCIVTRKRIIGMIDDVQIAKRTASLLLVRPDLGFSDEVAEKMTKRVKDEPAQKWHERVFAKSGVTEYLEEVTASGADPEWLLPISTVYYGYRDDRRKSGRPTIVEQSVNMMVPDMLRPHLAKATGLLKKP